jgi:hypothetical protein
MAAEPQHEATTTGTVDPTPPPPAGAAPPVGGALPAGESPLSAASQGGDVFDSRPELLVAGAFVGGLVLAQVLRKLGPS